VKVESRGKYPGVKLHLEPEEVSVILLSLRGPTTTDSGDLYRAESQEDGEEDQQAAKRKLLGSWTTHP
jgi:hypothetical protein